MIDVRDAVADRPQDGVVVCECEGGVATVTLNRPHRHNAWTSEMEREYLGAIEALDRRDDVRAVVVTGAGRSFCPGLDAEDFGAIASRGSGTATERTMLSVLAVGTPMVCAIDGPCAGIGLAHALACDVRFAASTARLATSFARRGTVAELASGWLLQRIVGHANALDLLISGRTINADEALALGVVHRVVDPDTLQREAHEYARDVAEHCAPRAVAAIKRQVYADWLQDAAAAEADWGRAIAAPESVVDLEEGIASYVERRLPRFATRGSGVGAGS